MIDKLKKQFIMWHMGINTIIVLACFLVIYLITLSSIQVRNNEKLNSLNSNYTGVVVSSDTIILENKYITFFSVALDEYNKVTSVTSPIDLNPVTINNAIELYLKKDQHKGNISFDGKRWIYTTTAYINQLNKTNRQEKEVVFLDVTESFDFLNNLLIIFSVVGLAVIFINFFISVLFATRVVRPISETFEKQKRFVADASHELKTPLAIITANTEALISENNKPEINHWTRNILTQIERMEVLIKNLLFLAKADEKVTTTELTQVNISNVIEEVLTEMEVPIYEKNIVLQGDVPPDIIVKSNAFDVKQVFVILLDNAIKYTDQGGKILIKVIKVKKQTTFTIENTCTGIPKEHLEHIFDRFYRVDESRSHDGGYGLGLSIAKTLMDRTGGSISVENHNNTSVSFTINFG